MPRFDGRDGRTSLDKRRIGEHVYRSVVRGHARVLELLSDLEEAIDIRNRERVRARLRGSSTQTPDRLHQRVNVLNFVIANLGEQGIKPL